VILFYLKLNQSEHVGKFSPLLIVALEGFSRRASAPRSKCKQMLRGFYDAKDDKVGASSFIQIWDIEIKT
jgi:hypothetical protein